MTGNELIDYLEKTKTYNADNNLFTNIIKSKEKFDLNYILDFYFGFKDKKDAVIICLAPIKHLTNELQKRIFYQHSSLETIRIISNHHANYLNNFNDILFEQTYIEQGLVILNFCCYSKNEKLSWLKIPVFYSEAFSDYQAIILTTKYGNKKFVLSVFPEYNRSESEYQNSGQIYNYPKNSPFNLK